MTEPLKLGLLGLGTVGAGTVQTLTANARDIAERAGRPVEITRIAVRDPGKARDVDTGGIRMDTDADGLVNDPDVDVVVELIGGVERAGELVLAALKAGKPVVTANKALIAERGHELFEAAAAAGQTIAFEAAVAGGIPIIKAIREGLAGNRITAVEGLINGTTNFILTRMADDEEAFADVLAEAQGKGYAEADPTFDIEGIDAAHKLAILASLAYRIPLSFDRIRTTGLAHVTAEDLSYAAELGYKIKHLAVARVTDAGLSMSVEPTLLPQDSFNAKIDGVMNAVVINGDAVGTAGFYGPGAGALATASAVVADIVDMARERALPPPRMDGRVAFADPDAVVSAHYMRMHVRDEPGVLQTISTVLAGLDISIDSIVQKEVSRTGPDAIVVLLTHQVAFGTLQQALDALQSAGVANGPIMHMPVEHVKH